MCPHVHRPRLTVWWPQILPLYAVIGLATFNMTSFMYKYFTGSTECNWDKDLRKTHGQLGSPVPHCSLARAGRRIVKLSQAQPAAIFSKPVARAATCSARPDALYLTSVKRLSVRRSGLSLFNSRSVA